MKWLGIEFDLYHIRLNEQIILVLHSENMKVSAYLSVFLLLILLTQNLSAKEVSSFKVYGSVRVMLENNADKELSIEDALSRIGVKSSRHLLPNAEGFAAVEYGKGSGDKELARRVIFAGVKGSWGSLSYGTQTQVWHKFVRGAKFSDQLDTLRLGTIRDQDSFQYFTKIGKIRLGTSRSFEKQGNEHTQFGVAIPFGKNKLGVAYTRDSNGGLLGIRPEWVLNKTQISILYYRADPDFSAHGANLCRDSGDSITQGIYAKQTFNDGLWIHARYMERDCHDNEKDARSFKTEIAKKLNNRTRLWLAYEVGDAGNVKDNEVQLGFRFDF